MCGCGPLKYPMFSKVAQAGLPCRWLFAILAEPALFRVEQQTPFPIRLVYHSQIFTMVFTIHAFQSLACHGAKIWAVTR